MTIRVAVSGATGRMGRSLINALANEYDMSLTAALENPNSEHVGTDSGTVASSKPNGVTIVKSTDILQCPFDVLIDFSVPTAAAHYVAACRTQSKKLVSGTTGLDEQQQQEIVNATAHIAICQSSNFSVGINLCLQLLTHIATTLKDERLDTEIIETHHRNKIDAPSGTALTMGKTIADALGVSFESAVTLTRHDKRARRAEHSIGISAVRCGDVVGNHTVLFAIEGEQIEVTHRAHSRMSFVRGALLATRLLMQKEKGLFSLEGLLRHNRT